MSRYDLRRSHGLVLGAVLAVGLSAAAAPASAETTDLTRPTQSATVADWNAWAEALKAEARSTDWAAESAARGCDMLNLDIHYATVPESDGAPAGLQVPVINRAEDCSGASQRLSTPSDQDGPGINGVVGERNRAGACADTSGPGSICMSRSGSYVTASFTYRGSSKPAGFIRIYERSSASGCGTGSTRATGSSYTYSQGETHSVSYAGGYDSYSASFWRKAFVGHTNWGTVCDSL